jgi:hypothetical protein
MTIKSEAFKNAYAIFVNPEKIPLFQEIITRNNITEADMFKATFDKNVAMVVLPNTHGVKETERLLFEQSNQGDGDVFWGQSEIGYEGRCWEKV